MECKISRTEDGVGVVDEVEESVQDDLKGRLHFFQCTLFLQLKFLSFLQILSNIGYLQNAGKLCVCERERERETDRERERERAHLR